MKEQEDTSMRVFSIAKALSPCSEDFRKPACSLELIMAVKRLRQPYPGLAKNKTAVLLKQEGFEPPA